MPQRNLKQATQDRAGKKTGLRKSSTPAKKAAKSVAKKAPKEPNKQKIPLIALGNNNVISRGNGTRRGAVTEAKIPGLPVLVPDQISAQLPTWNPEAYKIADPLNPNPSIPQVSQVDYDAGEAIYQGGIRAVKLTGLSFDLGKEVFTTIGKQAKAFGAGIKAATAVEAVRGDYYDYLSQVESSDQKSIALSNNTYKTDTDRDIAVHTQSELDEKLNQAEIAADMARAKTEEKQSSLNQFRSQLGTLTAAK